MTMFPHDPEFRFGVFDSVGRCVDDLADTANKLRQAFRAGAQAVGARVRVIWNAAHDALGPRKNGLPKVGDPKCSEAPSDHPGLIDLLRALARAAARIDHDAEIRRGETE